jgi:hypothetical protein
MGDYDDGIDDDDGDDDVPAHSSTAVGVGNGGSMRHAGSIPRPALPLQPPFHPSNHR